MSYMKNTSKPASRKFDGMIKYVVIAMVVIAVIACQYIAPTSQPNVESETATENVAATESAVATESIIATEEAQVAPQDTSDAAICSEFDSIAAAEQYNEAPPLRVDQAKQYFANFKMEKGGEFVVQLYPDKALVTVNSFVFLTCKGFYNGVTFHRVLDGFMAQGGDPTGTGMGGPGYEFINEDSDLTFDKAGVMAMANAGRDTNGSQFFITFAPAEFLNGGYTIFGQVIEGMDVVNEITRRDPEQSPAFTGDVVESVTISEK